MSVQRRSAKTVTRRAVRAARAARGPAEAAGVASALAGRAGELLDLVGARPPGGEPPPAVAVYRSLPGEPGTDALRAALRGLGVRLLLPVLLPDLDLDWVADDGGTAGPDPLRPEGPRLGTGALAGCALVLVPALAVDRSGTRLGQGGGSYDRALAGLITVAPAGSTAPDRQRPLVLAVVHDDELLDGPLPREPHDVAVDGVLTPSGPLLLPPR